MINKDALINVRNLKKSFGSDKVLKGINLDINRGEIISVIGRSGCGKTTLFRCLNCMEIADEGFIKIDDVNFEIKPIPENSKKKAKSETENKNIFKNLTSNNPEYQKKIKEIRSKVGFLFQNFNLFPHLTVLENVTIAPINVQKITRDKAESEAFDLLEKVGLKSFVRRYPHELSGGQQQRVAIARALALKPLVMLYDEPTSALDPKLVQEILHLMNDLKNDNVTQMLITHSMGFAEKVSDSVIYMEDGLIIEKDIPSKIFSTPSDERTQNYLSILQLK